MFGLRAPELIVIAVIVLLLFGAKRLPDTARSIGESLKIFKKSVRDEPAPPAIEPRQVSLSDKLPPTTTRIDGAGHPER